MSVNAREMVEDAVPAHPQVNVGLAACILWATSFYSEGPTPLTPEGLAERFQVDASLFPPSEVIEQVREGTVFVLGSEGEPGIFSANGAFTAAPEGTTPEDVVRACRLSGFPHLAYFNDWGYYAVFATREKLPNAAPQWPNGDGDVGYFKDQADLEQTLENILQSYTPDAQQSNVEAGSLEDVVNDIKKHLNKPDEPQEPEA